MFSTHLRTADRYRDLFDPTFSSPFAAYPVHLSARLFATLGPCLSLARACQGYAPCEVVMFRGAPVDGQVTGATISPSTDSAQLQPKGYRPAVERQLMT